MLPPLGASSHTFLSSGGPLVTKTLLFVNQVQTQPDLSLVADRVLHARVRQEDRRRGVGIPHEGAAVRHADDVLAQGQAVPRRGDGRRRHAGRDWSRSRCRPARPEETDDAHAALVRDAHAVRVRRPASAVATRRRGRTNAARHRSCQATDRDEPVESGVHRPRVDARRSAAVRSARSSCSCRIARC